MVQITSTYTFSPLQILLCINHLHGAKLKGLIMRTIQNLTIFYT